MTTVYKICSAEDWRAARAAGTYLGSADDRRDGFVHLSTGPQVAGTLAKFFARREGLVLVAFEAASLGARLRFERSGGGGEYPHLYGELPVALALFVREIGLDADGRHILPDGLA